MVEIIGISLYDFRAALEKASKAILQDGVVVYPTDTLYGLGGNAFSEKAVARIHQIKGSDPTKPLSVIMSDIPMIERYCEVDAWQKAVLRKNLPGPFTFLLRSKIRMPVSTNEKLGVRIPDSSFAYQLSELAEVPIITTSANPTGKKPPVRLEEIDPKILSSADVAIDAGVTKYKGHSAVVDLVDKKIVRQGVWEIELFGY
jgi:L-threonylcarbamoyladenylate synthase